MKRSRISRAMFVAGSIAATSACRSSRELIPPPPDVAAVEDVQMPVARTAHDAPAMQARTARPSRGVR